jgi:hypothetical protein
MTRAGRTKLSEVLQHKKCIVVKSQQGNSPQLQQKGNKKTSTKSWHQKWQRHQAEKSPSIPDSVCLCLNLVLWSFKPGTYQTRSFAELSPKFQTCGTQSRKFRAPSPTPNDWDPCAAYCFYCTRACAMWWLTRFDWLSHNGAQSHRHKGTQELWQFRKSSWDNPARALTIS